MKINYSLIFPILITFYLGNHLFAQNKSSFIQSLQKKYLHFQDTSKSKKKDSVIVERHPQDSKGEGFVIANKDSSAFLRISASIRIFGAYDINGLKGGVSFAISDIPVGSNANKNENSFFMTVNLTRFGLEAKFKTLGGIAMRMEADFNSSSNNLRIRHAFGSSKNVLVGQTWSVFSDIYAIPNTVDIEGPPTAVSKRTVQIRYFDLYTKKLGYALSVESPDPSVEIPDSLLLEPVSQSFPNVAARVNTTGKWGRLQLAGILRSITVRNLDGSLGVKSGYGFLLSNLFNLGNNFEIMSQALYGAGISSYLNVSSNAAADIILNPATGTYEINDSYGGFIALMKRFFRDDLALTLTYGLVKFIKTDIQPDTYFNSGQYATANAFWNSRFGFRIGVEYEYGYSKNKKGESGSANRLAFTTYFDF